MRLLTGILIFFTVFGLKSQTSKYISAQKGDSLKKPSRFSFDYSMGYQRQNMTELNRYYMDSFALKVGVFDKHIHHGMYRNLSFSYHPNPFWSIGLNYKIDQASVSNHYDWYTTDDNGNILDTVQSNFQFKTKNSALGVQLHFHWNTLFQKMSKIKVWDGFHLSTSVGISYNLSILSLNQSTPFFNLLDRTDFLGENFGYNTQFTMSYPVLKFNHSQLRLGFNFGYQWSRSNALTYSNGAPWQVGNYWVKANFSGINTGLRLSYLVGNNKNSISKYRNSANTIYFDVFGQALYGALGYDRILNVHSTRVNHSVSAGILHRNQFPWTYLRVFSVPVSYNMLFDFHPTKNLPHKVEVGMGLSYMDLKSGQDNYFSTESYLYPSLRIGYRYHSMKNGLFFRTTFTPVLPGLEFSDGYSWFGSAAFFGQRFMPWAGFSIGKTF